MTYRDLADRLRAAHIDNAAGEAALLAEHFCSLSPVLLRAEPGRELPDPEGRLAAALAAREEHYPLQYLLGRWPFWRQEYEVSPDCLIHRSDTETLVDYAARALPQGARVLDLCTGSGCIAVSLLCERPDLTGVAVDLYEPTLALARRNAAHNGLGEDRLIFLQGDVLSPELPLCLGGPFDAILSNPPYITGAAMETLAPELSYEPRAALYGGADGLVFYRRMVLAKDYRALLAEGGCMIFEIGYDQGEALCAMAAQAGCHCRILKDLGGQDRVAVVEP